MAFPTDLDGLERRRAISGRHAGEPPNRAGKVRRAQRHSKIVRLMRLVLPLAALAIAGFYAMTLIDVSNLGAKIVRTTLPKIIPSNLTMNNPRYRGFNKDGGAYVLAAKTANRDPNVATRVRLNEVDGEMVQTDGVTTKLAAKLGIYDTDTEAITLEDDIRINSTNGGWARLQVAQVDTRTSQITSTKPVTLGNPSSTISADTMKVLQKSKEMQLAGNVIATIEPPKPKSGEPPQASQATAAGDPGIARMFTGSRGPVEIRADRLDVDDVNKTATFVGNVRARQGETELKSPELRIAYSGAPSGGLTGSADAAPAEGGVRITSIVAVEPVSITQAPATRITGQTASFDAASQRATLNGGVVITRAPDTRITGDTAGFDDIKDIATIDGNVVLTQGADRKASGDHAEFHSVAETALLTGNVVLRQGRNELRGRRLAIDQKSGRSELTAPAVGQQGAGRIAAHFVQDGTKSAGRGKANVEEGPRGGGFTAMSSFRTDPTAPVDITADQLEMIEPKKLAVFRGDVQAQQGEFKIRTAELNAHYSGGGGLGKLTAQSASDATTAEQAREPAAKLVRLQARGKVVVASKNGQTATGDWADFDVAKNTATLGGEVVLSQGRNVVRGTRLVIDMTTGESVINTDNTATPQVAGEKTGDGWRAQRKAARPSAVFFPQDLRERAQNAAGRAASPATSSLPPNADWQPTTAPSVQGNN